jgi:hypothetical protein
MVDDGGGNCDPSDPTCGDCDPSDPTCGDCDPSDPTCAGGGPSVGSDASCVEAVAKMVAATATVALRLVEITPGGFDPGHQKALAQALNRLRAAQGAVKRSCVNLAAAAVSAALAAAAAAVTAAEAALAAAVTSGPIPHRPPVILRGGSYPAPLTAPIGGPAVTALPMGILPIGEWTVIWPTQQYFGR